MDLMLEAGATQESLPTGDGRFYDILLERRTPPLFLRGERKTASDLVKTRYKAGHLEGQLRGVDFLLVEAPQKGEFHKGEDWVAWDRAKMALARIALAIPVIPSSGPAESVRILKHLESRPSLEVREKSIVGAVEGMLPGLLRGLGLNPDRGGRLAAMREVVDEATIVGALHVERWPDLPGIGPKTMEKVRARLPKT